jgi:RNA 2',3'-cyclic 3'-phosphodiesterase
VRLFVALEIPPELRARFAGLIEELRGLAPQLRWVPAQNLHMTLKFIGYVADERRATIETALAKIRSPERLTLRFSSLGFFPNDKRPRVFWAGTEAPPALAALAAEIDQALGRLEIPPETRAFSPNVTLARSAESQKRLPPVFHSAVAARAGASFGEFATGHFALVESKLKASGAEYTTLRAFPFVGAL